MNTTLTILVSPSVAENAAALCAGVAGEPGAGMFVVPLGVDGVASYYFSSGQISASFADLLPLDEWSGSEYTRVSTGNAAAVKYLSDAAGMNYTQAQIQAVFDAAIVVDGRNWRTVAANLGVKKL